MDVVLPAEGCNIINSSTSFYNYSQDSRTRQTYVIYEGKAIKQSEMYNQYGYTYTGTCLQTGDLVYKPELTFYFNLAGFALTAFLLILISRLFVRKFWRSLR